jgi:hypothetical protein
MIVLRGLILSDADGVASFPLDFRMQLWRTTYMKGCSFPKEALSMPTSSEYPQSFISLSNPRSSAMTKDPEMFPDPDNFLPERFLDTTDPRLKNFTLPFGFGRRLCVGMHVALQSVFIFITKYPFRHPLCFRLYTELPT